MATWLAQRYTRDQGRSGHDDDCYAVYVLNDKCIEMHVRVFRQLAERLQRTADSGNPVRKGRWRIRLDEIKEVTFDPQSCRLQIILGPLDKRSLNPVSDEEAVAFQEMYTELMERLRHTRNAPEPVMTEATGWHRLAAVVPFFPSVAGLLFVRISTTAFVAYLVVVVIFIAYRYKTAPIQMIESTTLTNKQRPSLSNR